CEVGRIGARAQLIVTEDNIAVIVPNLQFISERVTNWSHTGLLTAFVVRVRVGWDADPDLVRRLMLEAAAENPHVLPDPAPGAGRCSRRPRGSRTCCPRRRRRSSCATSAAGST